MKSGILSAAILVAVAMLVVSSASPAFAFNSAPINFCNKSATAIYVAGGYYSPGVNDPPGGNVLTGPFVSHGWYTVQPNECQAIDNPFSARYMFWFAVNNSYNAGGATPGNTNNGSPYFFCVPNYFTPGPVPAFTYEEQNVNAGTCTPRGGVYTVVQRVDTWVDPTVNFTGQ